MRGGGTTRGGFVAAVACALALLWGGVASASFSGRDGEILYAGGLPGWSTISAIDPRTGRSRVIAGDTTGWAGGNGDTIAFVRPVPSIPPEESIWIADSDGRGAHQILAGFTTITDVAVSRDGGTIAFAAIDFTGNGPIRAGVFTVASDGTGLRHLSGADNAAQPDISPDGTKVVFRVFEGRTCDDGTDSDIHLVGVDGGRERVLVGRPNRPEDAPSFAPDGRSIVYRAGETIGPCRPRAVHFTSVRRVAVSGKRDRRLTPRRAGPDIDAPVFSPSGRRVVLFGGGYLRTIRADGTGRAKRIRGQSGGREYFPLAWVPR